jgi:hypothetical protein
MDIDYEALFQNPMFLGGIAALSGQKGQEGSNLVKGMLSGQQMQAQKQQQQLNALKIKQAQAQQDFNPQDYMQGSQPGNNTPQQLQQQYEMPAMPSALGGPNGAGVPMGVNAGAPVQAPAPSTMQNGGSLDLNGLLSGGMQAGYSPGEVAGMAGFMDPSAAIRAKMMEPYNLGPQQVRMVGDKEIARNDMAPPTDPTAVLQRTIAARDQAYASGNKAMGDQLDSMVKKQSGAFDQQMADQRMAETKAQHAQSNEFRAAQQDAAQGQREFQRQNQVQQQTTQFANKVQTVGIPAAQQQLDVINGYLDKYKGKDLPGYNAIDSLKPDWMLGSEAQQLRQSVQSFANVLLKTRSGAAVTEPEQKRFLTELGNGKLMPSDRLRQGMTMMQGLLDSEKRNLAAGVSDDVLNTYEGNGGGINFSNFRSPKAKAAGNISLNDASLDQLKALRAARKGQ